MRILLIPRITAGFGDIDPAHPTPHTGIDVAVPIGTKVFAPEGGFISRVVDYGDSSLGKAVFVKTKAGYQYIFGHLSEIKVHEGDRVHAGDLLALSGSTGNSTGPHVHMGVLNKFGAFVDPNQVQHNDSHLGILGKILQKAYENASESVQEHARSLAYNTAIGFLKGVGDLLMDLSYSAALIGGGLAIVLYVAGWKDGTRWAGMLTVGYVLIKYLGSGV